MKLLKVENRVEYHLQKGVLKYPDAPQHLEKKERIVAEMDRVHLRLHHQNYIRISEQLISTIIIYNQLHNDFEPLTQKHGMPLIDTLEEIIGRDIIFPKIR